MNVKDFEYLLEVATQGNISRAAEQLYISQSALTKFIQKKERELGGPLFRREGGYLVPTAMGEICIQKAREILELHDQLNEELEREKVKRMGSLRIGVSASRIRFLTQSVLPQHLEKFPDVPIMMRYKNSYELPQLLKKNEFKTMLSLRIMFTKFSNGNLDSIIAPTSKQAQERGNNYEKIQYQ